MIHKRSTQYGCRLFSLVFGKIIVCAIPYLRHGAIGVLRGEEFYRGRPTSYYRNEIVEWNKLIERLCPKGENSVYNGLTIGVSVVAPPPTFWDMAHDRLQTLLYSGPLPPNLDDVHALPVLLSLLDDDDQGVRIYAVKSICAIGLPARAAIPRLTEMINDSSSEVRFYSFDALIAINPHPAFCLPLFNNMLKDPEGFIRTRTARQLGDIDEFGQDAIPMLKDALRDDEPDVRSAAEKALEKIVARDRR